MITLFISTPQVADNNWINALVNELGAKNINCWVGARDFQAGESWSSALDSGLNNSQAMVCLPSADVNDQRMLFYEIGYTRGLGKRCLLINPPGMDYGWIPAGFRSMSQIPLGDPISTAQSIMQALS